MKNLNLLLLSLCLFVFNCFQLVHGQSSGLLTDLRGNRHAFDSMKGRKVLILLLPSQADTAVSGQLLRFKARYADSVIIIGLVCTDSCGATSQQLLTYYAILADSGIILSEGISNFVRGDVYGSVLYWLSMKNKRNRNTEPWLCGSKYFLSKQGKLYAQLGKETSLDRKTVDYIVQTRLRLEDETLPLTSPTSKNNPHENTPKSNY